MTKGTLKYVPKEFLEEMDDIKINFDIKKDSITIKKMVNLSRIGRELLILNNARRKK